jgi:hypothetical protein
MKNRLYFLLLMFLISTCSFAQTSTTSAASDETPNWVKMMDDENVNYYEAVEAFESYMKSHKIEEEEVEEELMGGDAKAKEKYEKEMKRENKKIRTEKQRKALVQKELLAYQIKRFKGWMQEVKPFVQENGHILTAEERNAIWLRQQEEMKKNSSDKK